MRYESKMMKGIKETNICRFNEYYRKISMYVLVALGAREVICICVNQVKIKV